MSPRGFRGLARRYDSETIWIKGCILAMTSNFDEIVSRNQAELPHADFASLSVDPISMPTEPDVIKRDRFELLSAYLDGEVTPDENRLVATWLSEDPETQCLYRRLLMLRQAMRRMPIDVAAPAKSVTPSVSKLCKHENPRFKKVSLAIACTAATLLVGSLTNLIGSETSSFQFSWLTFPWETVTDDDLELALDEPVIDLESSNILTNTAEDDASSDPLVYPLVD